MLLIRKRAYARAGLIGNPSDGYHGKTIAVIVRNFWAQVTLYEWEELELVWSQEDQSRFDSIQDLVRDVQLHGYYGGIRLIKATVKKFAEYCARHELALDNRNFSIRYESNIPRQVGLGGSSAIIVATLRCLMEFYGIDIPRRVQPSLALSVEREELGIAAGLQDRVIQVYEGVVYMDFAKKRADAIQGFSCGHYEPLDPALLPPLYLAYATDAGEPTEVVHNDLRTRFERADPDVIATMKRLADLTVDAREALLTASVSPFAELIDANFNLRRGICQIPDRQVEMVLRARRAGATAKFAGSGGAIIGTYRDQATWDRLETELDAIRCTVIRPEIR